MRGAYILLATIFMGILILAPMKVQAQALPELPASTVSELHLVNQQAGDLAFNMNGVKLPSGASSILILNGIYKTMQAYNQWAGGDEYLVQQAYYMEKQNMPAWLAQYSGDYIFWEIQFFGDHINMITDTSGNLVLNPNGKKALNVMIDENMDQAVKLYKATNNNSVENMPVPSSSNYSEYEAYGLNRPYLSGKSLYFWLFYQNSPHLLKVEDFTYCYISSCSHTTWNDNSYPVFAKFYPSDYPNKNYNIKIFDVTTNQYLPQKSVFVDMRNNTAGLVGSRGVGSCDGFIASLDGSTETAAAGTINYFLPNRGYTFNRGSNYYHVEGNHGVTNMGYYNSSTPIAYNNNEVITGGLFLTTQNGAEVQDNSENLPYVGTEMSADSISTITDAIAEIEPVVDPVTGIEIIVIPQIFPAPENIPLEEVPVPDPIPGGIEDFPQNDPEIAPPYDPSIDPATTPTEDTLPDSAEQIEPMEELQLVTGLQNRFPFSIPWDIYNAYKMLQAEREIPHWEWEMSVNLPGGQVFTHTFVLDLEFIDPVVGLFRDLFLLAFILGLAIYSYNKFFGGGA